MKNVQPLSKIGPDILPRDTGLHVVLTTFQFNPEERERLRDDEFRLAVGYATHAELRHRYNTHAALVEALENLEYANRIAYAHLCNVQQRTPEERETERMFVATAARDALATLALAKSPNQQGG